MSYISDDLNLPESKVREAMQKGYISCSWAGWEEIYQLRKQGKSMDEIAVIMNCSKSWVSKILKNRFPK